MKLSGQSLWIGKVLGSVLLLVMLASASCKQKTDQTEGVQQGISTTAPLFEGMGDHHFDSSIDDIRIQS